MNILVSSQKNQTAAMEQMAEKFSVQMAGSFEKVITPTFQKMNDSLDVLVSSVTKCQEDAIREILDTFLKEMNLSFKAQFEDFGRALTQLKDAQTDNANYTTNLYQSMSRQLSEAYTEHERNMRTMLEDTSMAQKEYLDRADRILKDNQISRRNSRQITSILQIISRKRKLLLRNSGLRATRPCRNMSRLLHREWIAFPQRVGVM